jgi:hypothetical protein
MKSSDRGTMANIVFRKRLDGTVVFKPLDTSNAVTKYGHIYEILFIFSNISIWKVLKCGAGEEWRRSVGPIV